jgi:hypothetical protein
MVSYGWPVSYKYLNTVVDDSKTFMYARQQNEALIARATKGTPRLSVLAMTEGADPPSANAYNVLEAM